MFKTRVNEMLGVKYPIIMGGMAFGISCPELVSAVSNAGAFGIVSTAQYESDLSQPQRKEGAKEVIRRVKDLTDKPFGINIGLYPAFYDPPSYLPEHAIELIAEEGIKWVETSGAIDPERYIKLIHQAGAKVIHKVSRVRDAIHAEKIGADMVAIVGWEEAGHIGPEHIGFIVQVPMAVNSVKVPVIAGGGIGDARGFAAAMVLGAEGVVMGTRFMLSKESPIPRVCKDVLLKAGHTDTLVVCGRWRDERRVLSTPGALELLGREQLPGAKGKDIEDMMYDKVSLFMKGDTVRGMVTCGQVVGLCHQELSVKEIIEGTINGAGEILTRLQK